MSRAAVQENNEKFMEAVRERDAKAIAARYTDDCLLLPNGAPRMEGPGAVEAFFTQGFEIGIKNIDLTTNDVTEEGDTLIEVGRALVTIEPDDGQSIEDSGDYVVVYRQQGGEWKMAIDIWNTDRSPS